MKRKQWISLLLATGMMASVAGQAVATSPTPTPTPWYDQSQATTIATKDGVTAGVTNIGGTIQATQLKVTVPTNIPFTLDPTIGPGSDNNHGALVKQVAVTPSHDIEIKNLSVVPVYAKITKVETKLTKSDDSNTTNITLVQNKSSVDKEYNDKYMMFAFKEKNSIVDFETAADWLVAGNDQTKPDPNNQGGTVVNIYTLNNLGGRIEATGHTKTVTKLVDDPSKPGSLMADSNATASDTLVMEICAYGKYGWHAGDTFTITPTIVVSAEEFKS